MSRVPWGRLSLAACVALGVLVLVDLWHYGLTGGSYWKRLYVQQVLPGVTTGRDYPRARDAYFYFYYFWFLVVRYWPWLPVLLAGLVVPWFMSKEEPQRKALIRAWAFGLVQAGTILIGFSLSLKRRTYYVYPYYIGLSILAAVAVYIFLTRRKEIYGYLVSGGFFLAIGIFVLSSAFPMLFSRHPRPKLNAIIQLGQQFKDSGRRLDMLQLDCSRKGTWSLRRQAMFYLNLRLFTCIEPGGIQLIDMRRDTSYQRDGSRILAQSYPFVIVDRGQPMALYGWTGGTRTLEGPQRVP